MLNAVIAALSSRRASAWSCSCCRAPRPPRLASLAFLVVAAFLLVNKVWSPQYSLWLVPLAVLALPRWRLLLAWMTLDALVWVPRMFYYLGTGRQKGLPPDWFLGAVVVRDALVVVLMRAGRAQRAHAPRRTWSGGGHWTSARRRTTRSGRRRCRRASDAAGRLPALARPHRGSGGEPIPTRRTTPGTPRRTARQQHRPAPDAEHHRLGGEPAAEVAAQAGDDQ